MFYKYNNNLIRWEKDWDKLRFFIFLITISLCVSFFAGRYFEISFLQKYERELILVNSEIQKNKFNRELFVSELKRLNVKYPHIVMAQSIVETGNFSSRIFNKNNNLFGMKKSKYRVSTSLGSRFGHSYYINWKESLYDYIFYQNLYLRDVKNESDYFDYLSSHYAESGDDYVTALKKTIDRENLRFLFTIKKQ